MRGALTALCAALVLLASGTPVRADGGEATSLAIAVPASVELGGTVELQARLVDSGGAPVAKALVRFTAPLAFLDGESEVTLADARTGPDGVAVATVEARTAGDLTVSAVFDGDGRYAASSAKGHLAVAGDGQLFAQDAGVRLPGLNAGPAALPIFRNGGPSVAIVEGTSKLWPFLSGWPVALVLMIIWSLYASVVVVLFRIVLEARRHAA